MIIKIKAKPLSGRQEVEKVSEGEYKVYLKSEPKDNKANVEMIKLLKQYFGKQVRILRGRNSRNKVVEI